MSRQKSDPTLRLAQIMNGAADLIIRLGYDKTTTSDIAEHVGLTRAIVYQHFESKDKLFEALLYREVQKYYEIWLEHLEHTSNAETIGAAFRSVLYAVHRSPFLSAMLKRDRHVFGSYVLHKGNLFESIQANFNWESMLRALQKAGAIRQDLEPAIIADIMNAMSLGLTTIQANTDPDQDFPFEAILETVALMVDRLLATDTDGNPQVGKIVILRFVSAARSHFAQAGNPIHNQRSSDYEH